MAFLSRALGTSFSGDLTEAEIRQAIRSGRVRPQRSPYLSGQVSGSSPVPTGGIFTQAARRTGPVSTQPARSKTTDPFLAAVEQLWEQNLKSGRRQLAGLNSWMFELLRNPRARELLKAAETGGYKAFYQGAMKLRSEHYERGPASKIGNWLWYEAAIRPQNFVKLWDLYLQAKALAQKIAAESGSQQPGRGAPGTGAPGAGSGSYSSPGSNPGGSSPGAGSGSGSGGVGPFVSYLLPWF